MLLKVLVKLLQAGKETSDVKLRHGRRLFCYYLYSCCCCCFVVVLLLAAVRVLWFYVSCGLDSTRRMMSVFDFFSANAAGAADDAWRHRPLAYCEFCNLFIVSK